MQEGSKQIKELMKPIRRLTVDEKKLLKELKFKRLNKTERGILYGCKVSSKYRIDILYSGHKNYPFNISLLTRGKPNRSQSIHTLTQLMSCVFELVHWETTERYSRAIETAMNEQTWSMVDDDDEPLTDNDFDLKP